MKIIPYLLPALLLALAANPAQAQSMDKSDKARGTVDKSRQADPPRTQAAPAGTTGNRASEARRQMDAEQRAHAERFPPKPARTPPPATTNSLSSSNKGK